MSNLLARAEYPEPEARRIASQHRDLGALDELLSFPARYLAELPIPLKITLQASGFSSEIHWMSELACGSQSGLVFDSHEVRSLAIAVQAERLWPAHFKGFCLRKLQDPSFRITDQVALEGAQPEHGAAWSLGRVLEWLELELVAAEWIARDAPLGQSRQIEAAA